MKKLLISTALVSAVAFAAPAYANPLSYSFISNGERVTVTLNDSGSVTDRDDDTFNYEIVTTASANGNIAGSTLVINNNDEVIQGDVEANAYFPTAVPEVVYHVTGYSDNPAEDKLNGRILGNDRRTTIPFNSRFARDGAFDSASKDHFAGSQTVYSLTYLTTSYTAAQREALGLTDLASSAEHFRTAAERDARHDAQLEALNDANQDTVDVEIHNVIASRTDNGISLTYRYNWTFEGGSRQTVIDTNSYPASGATVLAAAQAVIGNSFDSEGVFTHNRPNTDDNYISANPLDSEVADVVRQINQSLAHFDREAQETANLDITDITFPGGGVVNYDDGPGFGTGIYRAGTGFQANIDSGDLDTTARTIAANAYHLYPHLVDAATPFFRNALELHQSALAEATAAARPDVHGIWQTNITDSTGNTFNANVWTILGDIDRNDVVDARGQIQVSTTGTLSSRTIIVPADRDAVDGNVPGAGWYQVADDLILEVNAYRAYVAPPAPEPTPEPAPRVLLPAPSGVTYDLEADVFVVPGSTLRGIEIPAYTSIDFGFDAEGVTPTDVANALLATVDDYIARAETAVGDDLELLLNDRHFIRLAFANALSAAVPDTLSEWSEWSQISFHGGKEVEVSATYKGKTITGTAVTDRYITEARTRTVIVNGDEDETAPAGELRQRRTRLVSENNEDSVRAALLADLKVQFVAAANKLSDKIGNDIKHGQKLTGKFDAFTLVINTATAGVEIRKEFVVAKAGVDRLTITPRLGVGGIGKDYNYTSAGAEIAYENTEVRDLLIKLGYDTGTHFDFTDGKLDGFRGLGGNGNTGDYGFVEIHQGASDEIKVTVRHDTQGDYKVGLRKGPYSASVNQDGQVEVNYTVKF